MRTRFPSAKAAAARTSGLAGIVKRIGIDRYEKQPRAQAQALCGPDFLQRTSRIPGRIPDGLSAV
jgi:hypothetical protein